MDRTKIDTLKKALRADEGFAEAMYEAYSRSNKRNAYDVAFEEIASEDFHAAYKARVAAHGDPGGVLKHAVGVTGNRLWDCLSKRGEVFATIVRLMDEIKNEVYDELWGKIDAA